MSLLTDSLLQGLNSLLASGQAIPASDLRAFEAQVIAAIGILEARARGNTIHYTSGRPSDALGQEGDLGVNKDNGDFYGYANGTFNFLFNGAGKVGVFTPIAANQFGTHPAFTNQDTLNAYLLGKSGAPIVPVVPSITSFSPATAAVDDTVTITGTNFGAAAGTAGVVKFNGILANVLNWSATTITAKVPTGGATGKITVTTAAGTATSASNFTVSTPATKPDLLIGLGNSLTKGYLAAGGPSVTIPAGETDGCWPDELLTLRPANSLLIHNLGINGQDWGQLQNRVPDVAAYFGAGFNRSDWNRIFISLQEVTNSIWKSGQSGIVCAQNAKAVVDSVLAVVPNDAILLLFTGYPFANPTASNASNIDLNIDYFNAIALNQDAANSASVGLYAAVTARGKIVNVRTAPAYADANATIDDTIWNEDRTHPTARGNAVPAHAILQAMNDTTGAPVINCDYNYPAPDPNGPQGVEHFLTRDKQYGTPAVTQFGGSPQNGSVTSYWSGDTQGAAGISWPFSLSATFRMCNQYGGEIEVWVNGQYRGIYSSVGKNPGDIIFHEYIGGNSNVIKITCKSGYMVIDDTSTCSRNSLT